MGNDTSILEQTLEPTLPNHNYKSYCNQVIISLAIGVTLLAVEIILLYTLGQHNAIIISFGAAEGLIVLATLYSWYKARNAGEQLVHRKASTTIEELLKEFFTKNAELDIQAMSKEEVIAILTALENPKQFNNTSGDVPAKMLALQGQLKTHREWATIAKTNDPKLKAVIDLVEADLTLS